ncbi:fructose PTS transporter subunit IIA [Salibacterium qingdaonense]|uniref:PTS system IIA component, Fru family (TC 4.A.2) n=1 Tax=Salibacterium qingdaonense TaxID=266892 RepID=A0A1I4NHQ0_9BACI|nr:fructose PTS transporter subunit IIA [Salibacterium qingdaonense]SFM14895.1 PTS system IIA component, Fru family (TC 4.A.2) [Salibacterium qingdaonense]
MEINEILNERTMKTNMKARTKDEALHELAGLLLENDYITDIDRFMKDIYDREEIGQTGIGNYIAIPHGKSDFVKEIGVAIGITQSEIPWETLDDHGVKGIILFAVGNDNDGADNHLKLLSMFARKLGNDEVVEKLLQSDKTADVKEAFAI